MQSSDLNSIVSKFPSILSNFVGVFSIDNVPKRIKKNHFAIVNTEESTQPGKHWFCFIKKENKKYELFDSLDIDQTKIDYLEKYTIFPRNSEVKFNENNLQNSQSSTCGLFVLYFLVHRMHNLDLSFNKLINEIFQIETQRNENLVRSFANEHFN